MGCDQSPSKEFGTHICDATDRDLPFRLCSAFVFFLSAPSTRRQYSGFCSVRTRGCQQKLRLTSTTTSTPATDDTSDINSLSSSLAVVFCLPTIQRRSTMIQSSIRNLLTVMVITMVVMIDNTIAGVAGTAAFSPVLVGSRRFGKFVIRTHEETEQRYCYLSRQIASSRRWASPEIEAETVDENADSNVSDRMLSMDDLLLPTPDCDVNQIGPTAMAYIGDVVFELFVRSKMIWPARKTSDLQNKVVSLVRGECRTERKKTPDNHHGPNFARQEHIRSSSSR